MAFVPLRSKEGGDVSVTLCKQKHGRYKGMWNFVGGRFARPKRRTENNNDTREGEYEYEDVCKSMVLRKLFDETLEEARFVLLGNSETVRAFLGTVAIPATGRKSSLLFVFDSPTIDRATFDTILRQEACTPLRLCTRFRETTAVEEASTTEVASDPCVSEYVRGSISRVVKTFGRSLIVNANICAPVLTVATVDVGTPIPCAAMASEPLPVHGAWRVAPGVFLSDKNAARVGSSFRAHVSPTLIVNFTTSVNTVGVPGTTRVLQFKVRDSNRPTELAKMATYLDRAVKVMRDEVADGGRVLVHCHMGKHRSASVAAAYLMHTTGCTDGAAVRSIRFCTRGRALDAHTFHFADILSSYER